LRNTKLSTKHKLNEYFALNCKLNEICNFTNPDLIAETMVNEISNIIKIIAPDKIIQCTKKYSPWITSELKKNNNLLGKNSTKFQLQLINKRTGDNIDTKET